MERWRVRWFVFKVGNGGEGKKEEGGEERGGVRKLVWLAEQQLTSLPTTPSLAPSSPLPTLLCILQR